MRNDIIALRLQVRDVLTRTEEVIDWGLESLGIPELWRQSQGEGIKVAILDTGIDDRHPDLLGAIADLKDFTGSALGTFDRVGHGTHVAGIVAARANGYGVIGVAPQSRLLIGKVLGDDGTGSSEIVAEGIDWAVENGADVISLSLGTPYANDRLHQAVIGAVGKNKILVAAAGNYGMSYYFDTINYPARYDEAISVGYIDRNRLRSDYAAAGVHLDVMAPGVEVYSTYPMGLYARLSGTSMATPFVAGVCALCLAKHRSEIGGSTPCSNQFEMRDHLRKTAIDLGETGADWGYGYGLINPAALLRSNRRS
jgi:subtilisin family serine protease